MSLDVQVQILSVDTGNFYSNKEARLHWKNHKLRAERNRLINGGDLISSNGKKRTIIGLEKIEEKISEYDMTVSEIEKIERTDDNEELFELYNILKYLDHLVYYEYNLIHIFLLYNYLMYFYQYHQDLLKLLAY